MSLDPTLDLALQQQHVRMFICARVEFNDGVCNLMGGSGFVTFPVDGTNVTFTGYDNLYGSLTGVSTISRSVATSSPRCQITIMPPSPTGISAIDDATSQGCRVRVWTGAVSETTGLCQGVPQLRWDGAVDTTSTTVDVMTQSVVIDTYGAMERLFRVREGNRLNNAFHQSCYPNETGFAFIIEATAPTLWGTSGSKPSFAQVEISPTLGDRLSGNNKGGLSDGSSIHPTVD